ncbi:mannitol dehydrogenase family protein [Microbacterium sp. NPDC087665]|uniref:mannitol dehydrogenase family protein n=1 Tax=Microbacterium sp. NPDC087665 TaxID=3364194 RepID=UPI00380E8A4B
MNNTLDRLTPRAPVRIVHLGLGAFHRAHQAWYTARADPVHEWGIAAFTGRSPDAAELLAHQDCVYSLITRSSDGDRIETVSSIVAAHDGADVAALRDYLARPAVTIVTLTVTEKGYRLDGHGRLDRTDPEVAADIDLLSGLLGDDPAAVSAPAASAEAPEVAPSAHARALQTMPGRLLWALDARRRALPDATLTLIPCDNLSNNRAALLAALDDLAALASPHLRSWISAQVDIVGTSVDRITPRTTDADIDALAARAGRRDPALVVTEPFHSWILSGSIRSARPAWEAAGATFVGDIAPFEQRKLWMLNGAHSLLAYDGIRRGHSTIAEAIGDPQCAAAVDDLWDLAERHLTAAAEAAAAGVDLDLAAYRRDLRARFENPAIAHHLRQIAIDGSVKLRSRVVEPVRLDRAAGATGEAGITAIAAWIRFARAEVRAGRPIDDVAASDIADRAAAADPHRALLDLIAPDLAADDAVVRLVTASAD